MEKKDYDAIVVGAGPNGLAAAVALRQQGLSVLVVEAGATIGGGLRTAELTLPGFKHDICSAIHPMALASPFFQSLPLADHGLEFIHPPIAAAHPFDDGTAAVLLPSVEETAASLAEDGPAYQTLISDVVDNWPLLVNDLLGPLHIPAHPLKMARFGRIALPSALRTGKKFNTPRARGLWAGMAAHAIQPLSNMATSAIALVLMASAHRTGWPVARGGSQSIADALGAYLQQMGVEIETDFYVHSLSQLPSAHAVLFDVTPRQLLQIAGGNFSSFYRSQLGRYRYGAGVFKIDWALDGPVPFVAEACRHAATVHIGNTLEEIADYEKKIWEGREDGQPFVLFAQQSIADPSRAPEGKHTAWAYCHVPPGSVKDMTGSIEKQIERFAPGFTDLILARHVLNTGALEEYNGNYIGGDINGGVQDIGQLFTRPALRYSPYRTSAKGLYICSSSTPPGGGVHGMCGYHAARRALKDIFNISINLEKNI